MKRQLCHDQIFAVRLERWVECRKRFRHSDKEHRWWSKTGDSVAWEIDIAGNVTVIEVDSQARDGVVRDVRRYAPPATEEVVGTTSDETKVEQPKPRHFGGIWEL